MFNDEMYQLGSKRSVIRELFEYGKIRAAEVGADNVFDFSLGNPNVPSPDCVKDAIEELLALPDNTVIHGYTSAQGDLTVRRTIANAVNRRFGASISANDIYMTCGAAASLTITLHALCENIESKNKTVESIEKTETPEKSEVSNGNTVLDSNAKSDSIEKTESAAKDEIIIFAPYFPEYQVFIKSAGGKAVTVPFASKGFKIDFEAFERALTRNTKAVIINSPNNPSGVVYSEQDITRLTNILKQKRAEFAHPIFLISDEPYRELVYDDTFVPYIMNFYADSIVCYSYSKSLSLPGERIGYIAVAPTATRNRELYAAICGAGRALGYVCAPSLFQHVIAKCVDAVPDINKYRRNRDFIYDELKKIGFECVYPNGAFYLFVKALEDDANAFAERAKELGLLLVPGDDFAAIGYVRIAYCVSFDMIKRSIPAFMELYNLYK